MNSKFLSPLGALALFLASHASAAEEPAASPSPSPSPSASPTAAASPASTDARNPNDLPALKPFVNTRVTLEGTVAKASEGKSGTVRYLNFSSNYRSAVSLVFFLNTPNAADFTMEKLQEYVGKKIRVTGILGEHEGALQIKMDSLSQIEKQ